MTPPPRPTLSGIRKPSWEFYEAMCRDIALWGKKGSVQPQGNFPPNVHNFSSIPWLHYTEINLNLYTDGDFLPPIITQWDRLRNRMAV